MNTRLLVRVRKAMDHMDVPPSTKRYYQRQWVKSVRYLGDKWLLAKPLQQPN